jgi:hypothetical protein
MKLDIFFAAGLLSTAVAIPGYALKMLAVVTPANVADQGFSFQARQRESGAIAVRITRDTTRAQWQKRTTVLEVPAEGRAPSEREVKGKRDGKQVVYRFELSPEKFQQAQFRVMEVQTGPKGEAVIGGGTFFEFRLADFVGLVRHE